MQYRVYDTFNRCERSRHRSLRTAVMAKDKFNRDVRRRNGSNSYIPTRIEHLDDDEDWLPVDIDEVHDMEQHLYYNR
jgi:hypothetical protein